MRLFLSFFFLAVSAYAADYVDRTVLLLDTGVASMTVTNSGAGAATVRTIALPVDGSHRAKVWLSHAYINNRGSGASCTGACAITANLNYGPMYGWFEIVDTSGNPLSPPRLSSAFQIDMVPASTETCCVLPIEVLGMDNFRRVLSFTVPGGSATTGLAMALRINNYAWTLGQYVTQPKGAFRINGGAWIDISCPSHMVDENQWFGCYNGPQTVWLEIPIPDSSIVIGSNTFEFKLYPTDGNSSGYRMLGLDIIETPKTFSTISVTSNVATVNLTAHGYTTGQTVLVYNAPGMYGRFNGLRQITVTGANAFTFPTCGTNPNMLSCDSPDATYSVPTSLNTGVAPQPVISVARAIIPLSAFSWDDPTTWTAPAGGNAGTGATPFTSGSLLNANASYFNNTISAHCNDCHATGGQDLKYFNYSNWSIITRSLFHGLSVQDGLNIAAYIRGLSITPAAISRPWNPPYQPGPTITSGAVGDWSAGAGIDSQLVYDQDAKEYFAPSGSYSAWAPTTLMDPKPVPQQWQLPVWGMWLPKVYPGDYFSAFAASSLKSYVDGALSGVTAGNLASFAAYDPYAQLWKLNVFNFRVASGQDTVLAGYYRPSQWAPSYYSIQQWDLVREWELFKVKGFEGSCDSIFTARNGGNRTLGWCWSDLSGTIFDGAPHKTMKQQVSNTNDNYQSWSYISNSWYMLQTVNSAGNGYLTGDSPIDAPYLYGFLGNESLFRPCGYWCVSPQIFTTQQSWLLGLNTPFLMFNQWTWMATWNSKQPYAWLFTPLADRQAIMGAYAVVLTDIIAHYSGGDWTTFAAANPNCGGPNPSGAQNAWLESNQTPCETVQLILPLMVYYSVASGTIDSIQAWAAGLWPGHDFTVDRAATPCPLSDPTGTFPI